MTINSKELTDFINAVKEGIIKSENKGEFALLTPIDFEVSVVAKKQGKGGVNLAIVGAGGKLEKESISKIKFSMGNPQSWEEIQKMIQTGLIKSKYDKETMDFIGRIIKNKF